MKYRIYVLICSAFLLGAVPRSGDQTIAIVLNLSSSSLGQVELFWFKRYLDHGLEKFRQITSGRLPQLKYFYDEGTIEAAIKVGKHPADGLECSTGNWWIQFFDSNAVSKRAR